MAFAARPTDATKQFDFYCLSYKNKRAAEMQAKFESLGLPLTIHAGVEVDDTPAGRTFSIMYGHLAMIRAFHESSNADIGVFCEDDILLHKDFKSFLPAIAEQFQTLALDTLLIGYLCENPIDTYCNFPTLAHLQKGPYKILGYPDGTWGTQMYMITKAQAGYLLEKYSSITGPASCKDPPFAADWTITKEGNRALVYPLLVIEGIQKPSGSDPHDRSHQACKAFSYKEGLFI